MSADSPLYAKNPIMIKPAPRQVLREVPSYGAWISVADKDPYGDCLVWLAEEHQGQRLQTALFSKGKVFLVGNHFHFDMPKFTHWMPLPEAP